MARRGQPVQPKPSPAPGEVRGFPLGLVAIAATALSLAVHQAGGSYSVEAIRWLTLSLAAMLGAVAAGVLLPTGWIRNAPVGWVLTACLCAQLAGLIWRPIVLPMEALQQEGWLTIIVLLSSSAVLAGSLCADRPWLGRWTFPALVVLGGVFMFVLLQRLPTPGVDVLMFQRMSCDAFLGGSNPYAIRFPDPYSPEQSAVFYGPGVSVNGTLQIGFPYMPLSLLMDLPGHVLGNIRYANLAYLVLAVVLLARARQGRTNEVAGVLLLFSPITPLVLHLGWTDVHVVFMLALTWFCFERRLLLLPYVFGLLLVSKQYMLAVAPLGLLLLPRPWQARQLWRFFGRAAIPAAVVTLPFVLWNAREFVNSVVMFQIRQPFRPDALSYLNVLKPTDPAAWVWVSFAVLGAALAAGVLVGSRRGLTFPLGVAACLLLFFALSKQAFANYYFVVFASACAAVASFGGRDEQVVSRVDAASVRGRETAPGDSETRDGRDGAAPSRRRPRS